MHQGYFNTSNRNQKWLKGLLSGLGQEWGKHVTWYMKFKEALFLRAELLEVSPESASLNFVH